MTDKMYTLVSLIGIGKLGTNTYDRAEYFFPGDSNGYSASLFVEAILQKYKGQINKAIIIGTNKSYWNALLEGIPNIDTLLWEDVYKKRENGSLKEEDLRRIEDALLEYYHFHFSLIMHDSDFNECYQDVINSYSKIQEDIEKGTKVLLDITSGLRYMPLLAYNSIEMYGSIEGLRLDDVTIIYGEFDQESKKSVVRDVSNVWKTQEINKQIYNFDHSFNGRKLATTLKRYNEPKLGDWISDFTEKVQFNYVMSCRTILRSLNDLLNKNYRDIREKKEEVKKVIKILRTMINKIDFKNRELSYYLMKFSEILNRRKLSAQALISLKEAVYTCFCEKYMPEYVGKSISYNDLMGDNNYTVFENKCKECYIYRDIRDLTDIRNNIAHGGGLDRITTLEEIDYNKYYNSAKKAMDIIRNE